MRAKTFIDGKQIDRLFQKLGIEPGLASIAAFLAETYKPGDFSDLMKARRVDLRMSMNDLDAATGYYSGAVRRWERKLVVPRLNEAETWANALGLAVRVTLKPADMDDDRSRG